MPAPMYMQELIHIFEFIMFLFTLLWKSENNSGPDIGEINFKKVRKYETGMQKGIGINSGKKSSDQVTRV
jgi:hypothetical protein